MEWQSYLLLYSVILAVLLICGVWIGIALAVTGVVGILMVSGIAGLDSLSTICWSASCSFTLTAIPLFVLMAEIILRSGLSDDFYKGISIMLCRIPGGLIHTNIIGCGIFSAISGSSVATAAAIGTAAIPELRKRHYSDELSLGSLAAGGTLGILIPPSITMIIYGDMLQVSVAKLFTAGIVPGIIFVVLFMVYIGIRVLFNPSLVPQHEHVDISLKERIVAVMKSVPVLMLLVLILGGIYTGICTPTEAAALGVLGALAICISMGKFSCRKLYDALASSVKSTVMIMIITVGAQVLSFAFVNSGVTRGAVQWVIEHQMTQTTFIWIVIVLYLILGCFIDGVSIMILTLPLLYPIMHELNIDPIWFGVVMTILISIGQITPPMGVNIFTVYSIADGTALNDVIRACVPYWFIMLGMIIVYMKFPVLITWLPSLMY
ncbi:MULTISPECIES: TRAP transporter large permease [unclassified Pyramidobacter]|uniref:TRAP transporter large permease n=1 Tax=unclassified Pyramidobacter TaxID=2632171 RepID=UPI000EA05124|nr:TRAP transporter large permease subunit [Pyramidobacter sp. CG50-2]RKJ76090.1 TRAP transporter large permease subunit [Pyramidobacter sp. CG50-2]